jgi:hypothetical protein
VMMLSASPVFSQIPTVVPFASLMSMFNSRSLLLLPIG